MLEVKQGRPIEIKDVTEAGEIAGYGSVFDVVDRGYDVVERGAFARSLEERGLPKMLWGHDYFEPAIGNWTDAKEDEHGLYVEGRINLDMQRGREVHSAIKNKSVDGLSIGYVPVESDIANSGVRHIKQAELYEVSPVNFPMNESATIDAVKSMIGEGRFTKTLLERILRNAGFSRAQAKALVAGGYDALTLRDAGEDIGWGDSMESIRDTLRV